MPTYLMSYIGTASILMAYIFMARMAMVCIVMADAMPCMSASFAPTTPCQNAVIADGSSRTAAIAAASSLATSLRAPDTVSDSEFGPAEAASGEWRSSWWKEVT